jgi:uncharacterized glyoxalase superfamily protein PhnB
MGSRIIPTLRYADAARAVWWLEETFGFERGLVVEGPEGSVAHAQLTLGPGMMMLSGGQRGGPPVATGAECGRPTAAIYAVVDAVDEHAARARAAGAEIVEEPHDEVQGRLYSCRDFEGNLFVFGDYDPFAARA